jgi:hypothetical protein
MGLRPTKSDEDAECINSWQAETPAPPGANVGQALSPANSSTKPVERSPRSRFGNARQTR